MRRRDAKKNTLALLLATLALWCGRSAMALDTGSSGATRTTVGVSGGHQSGQKTTLRPPSKDSTVIWDQQIPEILLACQRLVAAAARAEAQGRNVGNRSISKNLLRIIPEIPKAAAPLLRGMDPRQDQILQQQVNFRDMALLVIDSNPGAARYYSDRNLGSFRVLPKPRDLSSCKSITQGAFSGLVGCSPHLFGSEKLWLAAIRSLEERGYRVDKNAPFLVRNSQGFAFASDLDVQTAISLKDGHDVFTEALAREINAELGVEMFQHPSMDQCDWREKIGLKLPITLYLPGTLPLTLGSVEELKEVYLALGRPWDLLWGQFLGSDSRPN